MIIEIGIILMIMLAACACGACIGFVELLRKLAINDRDKKVEGKKITLESITNNISNEMVNESSSFGQVQYV